jgi:hypothetical protein
MQQEVIVAAAEEDLVGADVANALATALGGGRRELGAHAPAYRQVRGPGVGDQAGEPGGAEKMPPCRVVTSFAPSRYGITRASTPASIHSVPCPCTAV